MTELEQIALNGATEAADYNMFTNKNVFINMKDGAFLVGLFRFPINGNNKVFVVGNGERNFVSNITSIRET